MMDVVHIDNGSEVYSKDLLDLVQKAINFIELNLQNDISVAAVTAEFENSHWYFQRLFASVVGVTMGQYLRERRLSEAANRLRTENIRSLDIAIDFGFSSEEAFSRSFKSLFGVTPSKFRSEADLVLPSMRNRITDEKLIYFWENVQRVPSIVESEQKILIGSAIEFKSHFILGSSCHLKVVPHWAQFKARLGEIPNRSNDERIGVVMSSEMDLRNEQLTYLSGVEVNQVSLIPEGMISVQLPKGLYACFENKTLSEKNGHLMDYIYGIWLPSSNFQRALGFDYEIFDHRYVAGDPNSFSRFFVPIEPKTKSNGSLQSKVNS